MSRFKLRLAARLALALASCVLPSLASWTAFHLEAGQLHPAQVAARIDRLLADAYPASEPGAAVFVARPGTTILQKGYGLADVRRTVPVTPDTVFRLASATKAFTSTAVLMLADRGAFALDDPVTKLLPAYPASGQAVTVRNAGDRGCRNRKRRIAAPSAPLASPRP
jgi:CubicO group peptidase (beta-lactamase class C family)